ncbi:PfkB family carbohydrate kinase [Frankia sp. AiPs1]|uniref:PfkB family carbohydrate kinase n=1 Tax=Frankia sp. AiPs1 TaxID=573493 RepID=UPI002043FF46|nr:PfkB family carbohydrate kinase [Frankia sp. AiPs1]MCM3921829.1 PfkB family carbohydrate kinase [Frankia sp. AiPs1]
MAGAPRFLVAGAFVLDCLVRTPRLPGWGEDVRAEAMRTVPGGKALNQAVTLARLGLPVAAVGAVASRGAVGARGPPPAASAWLTSADGTQHLDRQPDVRLFPSTGPAAARDVLRVEPDRRFQVLTGIGAALTDSSAYLIDTRLSARARGRLMRALFDRDAGAGLSFLRQPIGASDFSRAAVTYDDVPAGRSDPRLRQFSVARDEQHLLPLLRRARELNPDLRVMATPWTAPAWMRTGGTLSGSSGGPLRPEYTAAFAAYLAAYARAYADSGVPIDLISPLNEPLAPPGNHPAMPMTAQQEAAVIAALGPALRAAGLSTRIAVSDQNWDFGSYALQVLSDPAAAPWIAGVASHCYGGDPSAQAVLRGQAPNLAQYVTECSSGSWSKGFGDSLRWSAQNMVIGATRNGAATVAYWNVALDETGGPKLGGCPSCRGLVTIDGRTGNVAYSPEYYALGQLAKVAEPGAVRVDTSSPGAGGLENVAFVNPDGSRALVAYNPGAAPAAVTVDDGRVSFTARVPAGAMASFTWPGRRLAATSSPTLAAASPLAAESLPASGSLPGSGHPGPGGEFDGAQNRIRVMPLGDSLVDGFVTSGGWRTQLWHRLVQNDGEPVVFVGSQRGGPPDLGDQREEGHPGWRLDALQRQAAAWVGSARPDVVLLMAGTNDINEGASAEQATARLDALLRTILAARPGVTVLVSTLVPMLNGHDATWAAFNAAIPGVVAASRAVGANVSAVDLSSVVGADHYVDGLHPDQAGYNALGDAWYAAITPVVRRLRATAAAAPGPRMSASTVAVSACCTDTAPALAADGLPGTRWTSGYPQEPGMWLQADLRAPTQVSGVDIDTGPSVGDEPRGYAVRVSLDGTTWRTVVTRGDDGPRAAVAFPAVAARYVRVQLTVAVSDHWWSVADLTVHPAP